MHVELRIQDIAQVEAEPQLELTKHVERDSARRGYVHTEDAALANQVSDCLRDLWRIDQVLKIELEIHLRLEMLLQVQIRGQRGVLIR